MRSDDSLADHAQLDIHEVAQRLTISRDPELHPSAHSRLIETLQQLGLGPIHLIGHDVSMMVGYAYASAFPREVKRLVLMEAGLPALGLEKPHVADKYPRMYYPPLFEAPNGLAEAFSARREKMLVSHSIRQQAYDTEAI